MDSEPLARRKSARARCDSREDLDDFRFCIRLVIVGIRQKEIKERNLQRGSAGRRNAGIGWYFRSLGPTPRGEGHSVTAWADWPKRRLTEGGHAQQNNKDLCTGRTNQDGVDTRRVLTKEDVDGCRRSTLGAFKKGDDGMWSTNKGSHCLFKPALPLYT